MRALLFAALAVLFALNPQQAWSFGRGRVAVDNVTSSTILDGDATGLAEGCGQQPSSLGMFCRVVEGDAADKSISFIAPPAKCSREDACAFIKVFNNQGQIAWGGSIPKGKTRIEVPWRVLLGCGPAPAPCEFQVGHRGFWTFNTTVYWKDPDGRDRDSTSQGDIVLRVYRKGYLPLHAIESDPNFVWTWSEGGFVYRVTSGLRAFVGRI